MFCPLSEGYSFTVGNNVREQVLENGMPRQVIKFVGAVHKVTAQVFLEDGFERQVFWSFWRKNQTKLWTWNLVLDNGKREDCVCQFSAETVPQEVFIEADTRKMQVSVYVIPIKRNADFDQQILDMWYKRFNASKFAKVPNVYFPDATGVK